MTQYRTSYSWSPRMGQNGDPALESFVTGLCEYVLEYLGMNGEEPAANVKASYISAFRQALRESPFPKDQVIAQLGKSCPGWNEVQSAFLAEGATPGAAPIVPDKPAEKGNVLLPLLFTGALAFAIFDITTGKPGVLPKLGGML